MVQKITLTSYDLVEKLDKETLEVQTEVIEKKKSLILNFTAGLAIKIKRVGFDVYASLDSDASREWITNVVGNNESVAQLANVIWPDPDLDEYLNPEGIEEIRQAFLEELLNFTSPHCRPSLLIIIEEANLMIKEIAEKTDKELRAVMGSLRKKIVDEIPTGEAMIAAANEAYDRFQGGEPGSERIELSPSSVQSVGT